MCKYVVVFLVDAALAIWMIAEFGGAVDMGREKHQLPRQRQSKLRQKVAV